MMDDEEALKESVSNLRSAILLRRTDIIRSILSTAAECKGRNIFVVVVELSQAHLLTSCVLEQKAAVCSFLQKGIQTAEWEWNLSLHT